MSLEHLGRLLVNASLHPIAMSLFLFASYVQFTAHKHLSELPPAPNYTLPTHRFFASTLTPHYLAECLIYLSLALLAAPSRSSVNLTVASAAVFVVVNLGLTAYETRKWYSVRFGEERIRARAALLPYVW
jgi:3-oxo-5-alpha-steroid 4-dehydrogenase 3 / polyprenol reductase